MLRSMPDWMFGAMVRWSKPIPAGHRRLLLGPPRRRRCYFLGLLVLVGACSSGAESGALVPDGVPNPSTEMLPGVSSTRHADLGEMTFCTHGAAPVTVTSVTPINPDGQIHVVDVRARPNPLVNSGNLLGSAFGALAKHGFPASRTIRSACSGTDRPSGSEVAIELAIQPGTEAAAAGWRFHYRVGNKSGSTTFPLGVVLCSTPTLQAPACARFIASFAGHRPQ
jgi:hypothetical protein